ncbi:MULTISPECIES: acetyltransferase [unclassified Leptolyngbya]|uniref:acetyltransferase n=1 Tax=unclassified Leptolyngbya TaxID=2650499 RepID=UPI00168367C8|nr:MULTISPECIES: acetyltransferase [unclassified Leptolyngbya]MBD1913170.1 acetyltransferase [Leptolyngbya sp. FACHB-8]MBD2158791.1 acetyltransferase [Leptolyngbya sp. FACHB-16]
MQLQEGIFSISTGDFPQVVKVWEASVRATHHFLTESHIQFFKPLIFDALSQIVELDGVRNHQGEVVGFIGVVGNKIEMLFIDPAWHGQGIGRQLIQHAIGTLGVTKVDVNEQNEQAVGFYLRMGFEIEGRSEVDGMGKPFPLLHLRLRNG